MTKRKPALIVEQKESGRRAVFSTIRREERVARIDIAQETGMSPATVTGITAELIDAGLIEEIARDPETSDAKRGRPRVDLKVRGAAHLLAGIKVSDRQGTVAILDFEGGQVGECTRTVPHPVMRPPEFVAFIGELLAEAAGRAGLGVDAISGIGIGIAGFVDAPRGTVHWSPSLTERNVPLRDLLSDNLPLPVFLDNDANLVAKAEQWFGLGRKVANFIVITIERGVGMGIVINNEIYRGTRGCGAEFGHTKVQLDGALCRCGQRGCLEAYVADYALLREADIMTDTIGEEDPEKRLMALFEQAQAGNHIAQSIFHRAGRMFAMGLANIVNVIDPALIILSGERMQFDYLYADDVIESMQNSLVEVDAPQPEVRIHKWGDLMWAKGAAAYAMEGVTELALSRMSVNGQ